MKNDYPGVFDRHIQDLFRKAARITLREPARAGFFLRVVRHQQAARRRRERRQREGLSVPAMLIISVTHRCNLNCKGCYTRILRDSDAGELSDERLHALLTEARDLGVSIVMLAGGEPLTRPGLLAVTRDFPEVIFPFFTNGLLLDEARIQEFRRQPHVIPIVSLEGHEAETDDRRGAGVYERLRHARQNLSGRRIFWGCSLTVTRHNFDLVTGDRFVSEMLDSGCRVFIYVEYVPVRPGSGNLVITPQQKAAITPVWNRLHEQFPGLFIVFPGDEEVYGGCLAAGRGFVHINAAGAVEPCPFAPCSDTSVREQPLRAALNSDLLRRIRENHAMLRETKGGCALWENRAWVQSLLAPVVAAGETRS